MRCGNHTVGFELWLGRYKKCLRTGNIDGVLRVNDATVGAHTVSARRSCLDFETHISLCGVGELQSSRDNICKRAWGGERDRTVTQWCWWNYELGCLFGICVHGSVSWVRIKPEWLIKYIHMSCLSARVSVRVVFVRDLHIKHSNCGMSSKSIYCIIHAPPSDTTWHCQKRTTMFSCCLCGI